jgi:hypothetical protein
MKAIRVISAREIGIVLSICLAVGCVTWGGVNWFEHRAEPKNLGDYGSYLQGAVASPWALAGVFLIFVAFLAQGQQIELQQQELKLQRENSERQRAESDVQFKLAYKQAFESTFFQLLDFQNQIVSGIRTKRKT